MKSQHAVRRVAVNMNGISVAYLMGVVNAVLAAMVAFGVHLNDSQQVAVAGLVNAALILGIHLAHRLGEVQAAGGSGALSRAQTAEIVSDSTPAVGDTPGA